MSIRYQADNDLNQIIVDAVRCKEPAIDFQTAHQAKLHHLDDPSVLPLKAGSLSAMTSEQCRDTLHLS